LTAENVNIDASKLNDIVYNIRPWIPAEAMQGRGSTVETPKSGNKAESEQQHSYQTNGDMNNVQYLIDQLT